MSAPEQPPSDSPIEQSSATGTADPLAALSAPEPVSAHAPDLPGRLMMRQRWENLTFLHWRVEPGLVAPMLPPGTRPDIYDGSTWVGLIPFRLVGAGAGLGPAVPWLGTFAETNVRLYSVDASGRRGVVFCSLESSRLAVVLGARLGLGVKYTWARMRVRWIGPEIHYQSERLWPGPYGASTRIVVRPGNRRPDTDRLADFLTARWGLHTRWLGRTLYVPNRHEPWPLHDATLLYLKDDLVAAAGLPGVVDRPPDSVLFSPGVHTEFALPYDAARPGR